jgi:hypothetical protein
VGYEKSLYSHRASGRKSVRNGKFAFLEDNSDLFRRFGV